MSLYRTNKMSGLVAHDLSCFICIPGGKIMSVIVDAGGLSCPQPVLMLLNKIKEIKKGEIIVIVDTDTSKENVSRAATSQGWEVADIQHKETGYQLTIRSK
jgi:tRNA 2-thiouridine synthesizing protein A